MRYNNKKITHMIPLFEKKRNGKVTKIVGLAVD